MVTSAGSLGGAHDLLADPDADALAGLLGCGRDGEELVVRQSDALDVAAGVVDGGPSGSRHGQRLAPTESLHKVLPDVDFRAYGKSMTTWRKGPAGNYESTDGRWLAQQDEDYHLCDGDHPGCSGATHTRRYWSLRDARTMERIDVFETLRELKASVAHDEARSA